MKRNTVRLTESQLHDIVKESVKNVLSEGVYTEEEQMAHEIYEKAMNILASLGTGANLIAYILNPMNTAIGASFSYNKQTFEDLLWSKILNYARNVPKNGNADYTLKQVYQKVREGYFD